MARRARFATKTTGLLRGVPTEQERLGRTAPWYQKPFGHLTTKRRLRLEKAEGQAETVCQPAEGSP